MENNFEFHAQENEECDDDAISLIDFPMSPFPLHHHHHHHTSNDFSASFQESHESDYFEFFSQLNNMSDQSHAETINFCGKLIPLINNPTHETHNFTPPPSFSSPDHLKTTTGRNTNKKLTTTSSFDFHSSSHIQNSSSSAQNSSRFDGCNIKKSSKPSWYILLFGSLIIPREMDLRDIKNRQVRRTPSAPIFFPGTESVTKPRVSWKRSWGRLKTLSCRSYASVHVRRLHATSLEMGGQSFNVKTKLPLKF